MLTFDKIRDLERAERESKQLQRLPENMLDEIRQYLRKKEKMKQSSSEIMEMENVKSTIKRFFELREKKVVESALYTVKTGLPVENITKDEEKLYYSLVEEMKRNREIFFREIQKEPVIREKKIFYKVRTSLPAFIGPDMNTYKMSENEIIEPETLPKPLNDFLLKKGIIEKTEE